MKGIYLVFFRLSESKTIKIGALGELSFDSGTYIYAGSGRNSIEKRIERHFSSPENKFWHIDYFGSEAEPIDYFILPEESEYECFMAERLDYWCEPVKAFGSSDCDCNSHLFRVPENF